MSHNPYGIVQTAQISKISSVNYPQQKFNHSLGKKKAAGRSDLQHQSDVYNVRRNKSVTPKPIPVKAVVGRTPAETKVIMGMVDLFKHIGTKKEKKDATPRGETRNVEGRKGSNSEMKFQLPQVPQKDEPNDQQNLLRYQNKQQQELEQVPQTPVNLQKQVKDVYNAPQTKGAYKQAFGQYLIGQRNSKTSEQDEPLRPQFPKQLQPMQYNSYKLKHDNQQYSKAGRGSQRNLLNSQRQRTQSPPPQNLESTEKLKSNKIVTIPRNNLIQRSGALSPRSDSSTKQQHQEWKQSDSNEYNTTGKPVLRENGKKIMQPTLNPNPLRNRNAEPIMGQGLQMEQRVANKGNFEIKRRSQQRTYSVNPQANKKQKLSNMIETMKSKESMDKECGPVGHTHSPRVRWSHLNPAQTVEEPEEQLAQTSIITIEKGNKREDNQDKSPQQRYLRNSKCSSVYDIQNRIISSQSKPNKKPPQQKHLFEKLMTQNQNYETPQTVPNKAKFLSSEKQSEFPARTRPRQLQGINRQVTSGVQINTVVKDKEIGQQSDRSHHNNAVQDALTPSLTYGGSTQAATSAGIVSPSPMIPKKRVNRMRIITSNQADIEPQQQFIQPQQMQQETRRPNNGSVDSLDRLVQEPQSSSIKDNDTVQFEDELSPTKIKPKKLRKSKSKSKKAELEELNQLQAEAKEERELNKRKLQLKNQKEKEDKYKNTKIKPPLGEELGSFSACAVVISYIGFEDEVKEFLIQLNQNSYGYFIMHQRMLKGFLPQWYPEFNAAIDFGEMCSSWSDQYPVTERQLSELPSHRPVNLKAIRYKCDSNNGALTAIQFQFTRGFESPFFFDPEGQQDRERETLRTIRIDTSKTIRKIGMIVHNDDQIIGLRLVDEKGVYIQNVTWMTKEKVSSDWIIRTLPVGRDIIGLRCKYGAKSAITSLGFMTWTPRAQRPKCERSLKSKESFLLRNNPSSGSPSPLLFKQTSDY